MPGYPSNFFGLEITYLQKRDKRSNTLSLQDLSDMLISKGLQNSNSK